MTATHYELTLYVSGASDISARAIADARRICDVHLGERCRLSVVDVHDDPVAARTGEVIVTPTLIRYRPPPVRRIIGDLSDVDRVVRGLDLVVAGPAGVVGAAPTGPDGVDP